MEQLANPGSTLLTTGTLRLAEGYVVELDLLRQALRRAAASRGQIVMLVGDAGRRGGGQGGRRLAGILTLRPPRRTC